MYQDYNLTKYLMTIGEQYRMLPKCFQDEMLNSFGVVNLHISEGTMCSPKSVPVPMSKTEIQQISVSSFNGT